MPSIAPADDLFAQTVAAAEAAAVDEHGDDLLDELHAGDAWLETPVDFETFCYSKDHLGLPPLFPRQIDAVYALIGRDPKRLFEHVDPDQADELSRRYQLAVLLWGKGSGKDYLCSVLTTYLVYVLLCLRNPQAYFELAPGENIDLVNVAYSADQAKKVFFQKFKQRLYRWRWLRRNFDVLEGGRRKWKDNAGLPKVEINDQDVVFPRMIRCFSRHSANESYEGLNIIAWIMDEASAFLSAAKRENANAIYQTLRTSAGSRFGLRWVGLIISYPRHADDFTCTKVKEATANPDAGIYGDGPAATWEINQLLGRRQWVEVRPGVRVPVELANDFILDFDEAKAKYMAMPPLAKDALIKDADRVHAAVQKGRKPLIEWEPTVTRRQVVDGDGNETVREFSAVKITHTRALPKGSRLFFHGDPARSSDGFALGFAHGVPATIELWVPAGEVLTAKQMAQTGVRPETPVRWEQDVTRTVIDALIVWRPDPKRNQHVDQLNVREVLKQLVGLYRIGGGSFDHYDSAELVQWLEAKKLPVENEQWSNPFQHRIYRGARSAFYNDLVTLPDTPSVTSTDPKNPGAVYELLRVEEIEGHKIDHPEGGCFTGEVRIPLLDGTLPTIAELAGREAWVYSARPDGTIVPGRARGRLTKHVRELVDVVLDSGAVERCTPEHLWMLRDGSYKPAQDLVPGVDRLMPIRRTWPVNGGYERLSDHRGNDGRKLTHHLVYEHFYGPVAPGHLVHHRNEIKTDNRPENLEALPAPDHARGHTSQRWAEDAAYRAAVADGLRRFNESDDGRRKHAEAMRRTALAMDHYARARNHPAFRGDITLESIEAIRDHPAAENANAAARILGCGRNVIVRVLREHGYDSWAQFRGTNHKVRAVIPVKLEESVPVYDLEVDDWHNFALSSGVFVHNSKDLADVVARLIEHVSGQAQRGFAFAAATPGGSGTVRAEVPVPGRTVDPDRPRSPVTPAMRERQAEQEKVRPAGALVEGQGRRFSFGVARGSR